MTHVQRIMEKHPARIVGASDELVATVTELSRCADTNVICADACLSEQDVRILAQCIRLNLDCADECDATANLLSRVGQPEIGLWRMQLEACREACRACAQECERHAQMHEHCRVCGEQCRSTEQACTTMLSALSKVETEMARHAMR